MKTYIDYGNIIVFENFWIPKDPSNKDYQQFLEEQKNGEAIILPYTPPLPTWEEISNQRNTLLRNTDWTVLDNKLANKQDWENYRQILRDIPQSFKTPESVIWPIQPPIIEQF